MHLPAPKTHFSQDEEFSRDTPIFCTSKEEFTFVRGGMLDQRETEMMRVRWKVFSFHPQIPKEEQQCVSPCPQLFCGLDLLANVISVRVTCYSTSHQRVTIFKKAFLLRNMYN